MPPNDLRKKRSESDSDRTSEADSYVQDGQDERTEKVVAAVDQDHSPNAHARTEDPSTGEPNRASSAGTCPVCGTDRPIRDGRIAHHHGTLMRWSGRRWFRQTCKGSGLVSSAVAGGGR